MSAQAIGSLFVALGLDSAAFQAGAKVAQNAANRLQGGLNRFGNAAEKVGTRLSVVSAGMAAIGVAAGALVMQTAQAGVEIQRQSQVANASAEEFQKWAAGAKTVGIEQDKLADILKDVNDRVGDFNSTGGGPMADFFEKIAPKVGITADAFRDLSGPQALQLYYDSLAKAGVSQQEMTFYLEAMASDTTALIPLLAQSGAQMKKLGDAAAAAGGIMSNDAIAASVAFSAKMDQLKMSLGAAAQQVGVALMPVLTQLIDTFLVKGVPALQAFVGKIEAAIQWLSALPAPVQEAAAMIAAVFGTAGPILVAIGMFSKALGAVIAASGPVGLFIAAATLAYMAWQKWGDDIKAAIAPVIDWISEKFTAIKDFLANNAQTILLAITGPIGLMVLAWQKWGDDVKFAIGGAMDWVRLKFDEVVAYFAALPERFAQFGRDLIDGLTRGITEKWDAAKAAMSGLANSVSDTFTSFFSIQSPSRVFMQFGRWISEGLAIGIGEGKGGVKSAVQGVADAVEGEGVSLSGSMDNFAQSAQSAFNSVISGSMRVKDALKQVATQWLSSQASGLFSKGMSGLMGAIGIPGFANGTNYAPGGLATINERGGEIVNLPSGAQVIPHDISKRMADGASQGGATAIQVSLSPELVGQIIQQAGAQSIQIVQANNRALPDLIQKYQGNPRGR